MPKAKTPVATVNRTCVGIRRQFQIDGGHCLLNENIGKLPINH
ncbi:hypothetical protein BN2497_6707 [Janthinobacterium sp. CG23_2]|nr:hypothetical protein BN2497_6707 [Janthinobacterium sp. CG23_2]CUU29751.1 hypothetical protein BN3177_6707 [Janthinobacterium sp. CG23_2]